MVRITYLLLCVGIALALPVAKRDNAPVPIAGKYIITLRPGAAPSFETHLSWVRDVHTRSLSRRDEFGIEKVYSALDFHGYAGSFDEETIAQIRANPDVSSVEQDQTFHLTYHLPSQPRHRQTGLTTQKDAPWGLGSISHRAPNSTDYIYDSRGDAVDGYTAYVVDTGIRTTHNEFEGGRAIFGYNAYPDADSDEDNIGHGTHVSGTIAGKTYGVAKKARVVAVKVFDWGSSTTSIVLDGYLWAVNNITTPAKSVINLSLGGPQSDAVDSAIAAAYSAGILTVVAAGNDGRSSDNGWGSPASAPEALAVGAVDVENVRPSFSNWGPGVDIWAPGVMVRSAWNWDDDDYLEVEGTSMASPHVAGLVLYLRSLEGGGQGGLVGAVVDKVRELGTKGVVKEAGRGSVNLLTYNGNGA
ncbi:Suppressor of the cold-sensitive snRNP biogenesis mutant brr1-1 [Podospora pseudopauciseta]|uniref:Suppressor of the cold-sensitive snRNP biogenesis mutant brr1-1 n=1 Tax=Podospora pseudopauciseta TaxID=2093780 RepID=A0ABR0HBH9_9PEZI|nr:Suppressor of the cold-sensitive snRNP biogenesis mutant brr1-1 [Podospora pseudopauciseta]